MGQYYYIVNKTKCQYLHPHRCKDGLKLMEFATSGGGTMGALALLLADGNGRGGGDCRASDPHGVIGSWAGDSIVVAGDYADAGKFLSEEEIAAWRDKVKPDEEDAVPTLHAFASDMYEEVSAKVFPLVRNG